jgi:hypothetical protein
MYPYDLYGMVIETEGQEPILTCILPKEEFTTNAGKDIDTNYFLKSINNNQISLTFQKGIVQKLQQYETNNNKRIVYLLPPYVEIISENDEEVNFVVLEDGSLYSAAA